MTTSAGRAPAGAAGTPLRPITVRWALKRAIIGIVILVVAVGGVAWLTYASIDPDPDLEPVSRPAAKAVHEPLTQVRL